MKILGIETSCDETAASIIECKNNKIEILSNIISSQINIHKKYHGVVPEIAARQHVKNILPVIDKAFKKANLEQEKRKKIDLIAVTQGPGLVTSLIPGIETAKVLAYTWNIPVLGINHIEGHIYANFIKEKTSVKFPALILTVSGGHTMLVLMSDHGKYEVIGDTRDDSAGEAFDKAAKFMNLDYPGGPVISKYAKNYLAKQDRQKIVPNNLIKKQDYFLPRPMINSSDFDFSFSGLKTALLYKIKADSSWEKDIEKYCFEFQQAIIEVLIYKTIKAAKKYSIKSILLSGGVSANKELRKQLKSMIKKELSDIAFHVPDLKYTTDNAVMIAVAGYYVSKKKKSKWQDLKVDCNLEL